MIGITKSEKDKKFTTNVAIGIQARSDSVRFPDKSSATIGSRTIVEHTILAAQRCAAYLNSPKNTNGISVSVNLLIPYGDMRIRSTIERGNYEVNILEGDPKDVLSRYVDLQKKTNADYIVRITGDCPKIPPFIITKHITLACVKTTDYCSNVWPDDCRTAPDGFDCEVISSRLLEYINFQATDAYNKEHVTTFIRANGLPPWALSATTVGHLDLSSLKISVDTQDDLLRTQEEHFKVEDKYALAITKLGRGNVHRI